MAANRKTNKLTIKEESLVQAMLVEDSQRKAMIASLYSTDNAKPETIDNKASAILRKPHVKARYDELRARAIKEAEEEGIFTVKQVLKEIKDLLDTKITDIAEIVTVEKIERDDEGKIVLGSDGEPLIETYQTMRIKDTDEMSEAALKSISEIGHSRYGLYVKRYDKQKTIDQAGKHLKLFTDKVEHSGEISMPIIKITK